MPIALQRNGSVTIPGSEFVHATSIRDRSFSPEPDDDDSDSSSSSSIGRNSDSSEDSSDREDSGEVEVQSSFKGPLDTVNDIGEVLPGK
ncbi:suppressor protein SRP40-like [Senna tora]|uniref:Suppressor protein SRP40-like n=1 Tax=Senna tora TaxID=362788 RepID=A0A835CCH0_9FABA|nr:suppressor protein SRP40-like [Senna tora]